MPHHLEAKDHSLIREQEHIAQSVIKAIQDHMARPDDRLETAKQILELRDEAARAKDMDLPALFDQLASLRAVYERPKGGALPPIGAPYFAFMKLSDDKGERAVLIGQGTFLEGEVPIIDWRHAPIARIFFKYREGEQYEEVFPGRVVKGTVTQRLLVTFQDSKLVAIHHLNRHLIKDQDHWQFDDQSLMPTLRGGQGLATRSLLKPTHLVKKAEISGLLDREQYEILTSHQDLPLLVIGAAGSGKTTVALHRIAHLIYEKNLDPKTCLVIVPEVGLQKLTKRLLTSLELPSLPCVTFSEWLEKLAFKNLPKIPTKICEETPERVSRFKRHPSIELALHCLIDEQKQEFLAQVKKRFKKAEGVHQFIEKSKLPFLELIEKAGLLHEKQTTAKTTKTTIKRFYLAQTKKYSQYAEDRETLLIKDRYFAEVMLKGSELNVEDLGMIMRHGMAQTGFYETEDDEVDIDDERLITIDGKHLKTERQEDSIYKSIDPEDFTLLLRLKQLKSGPDDPICPPIEHLLIDEAQDFAPIELALLREVVRDSNHLTIAGDAAQALQKGVYFESWDQLLDQLDCGHARTEKLMISYRSTQEIADFAHKILGPLAQKDKPVAERHGAPVQINTYQQEGQALVALNEVLTDLMVKEPLATVCVIVPDEQKAPLVMTALNDVPKTSLVTDGAFLFHGGINVATIHQVKGLEFDYVIIFDGSKRCYPATPLNRRKLHVAATRAVYQLWVVAVTEVSAIFL